MAHVFNLQDDDWTYLSVSKSAGVTTLAPYRSDQRWMPTYISHFNARTDSGERVNFKNQVVHQLPPLFLTEPPCL